MTRSQKRRKAGVALALGFALWVAAMPGICSACTILTAVGQDQVLLANNEDFTRPGMIWFVPAARDRLGRVNVGFETSFAQGSMNSAGLAFDSAALSPVEWQTDPEKKTPKNLLEKIMDECSSVAQAIEYFERFNCPHLARAQFLFADASGDSAVIAWVAGRGLSVVRIDGDHQVVTNTRLEQSGYRDQRFVRAHQELAPVGDKDVQALAQVLDAVHQRGPGGFTSYSTIYDLKRRRVHLYNLANFGEVVEFDLKTELRRGRKKYKMRKLFEHSPTLEQIQAGKQRLTFGTRVELTDEQLERFAGSYSPVPATGVVVSIMREGNRLKVFNPGQPTVFLFPEGETLFRLARDRGQVSFELDAEGQVIGVTLHRDLDIYARRVDSPAKGL